MSSSTLRCTVLFLVICALTIALVSCGDDDTGPGPGDSVGPGSSPGPSATPGPGATPGPPASAEPDASDAIPGSGDIVTDSRPVEGFDQIVLYGQGRMVITMGKSESLTIETDDNLLQYIQTEVKDGILEIRTEEDVDIDPTDSIEYRIAVTELFGLELAGGGTIEMDDWSTGNAVVVLSGAGDISIDSFKGLSLTSELSGVGNISLAGTAGTHELVMTGAGDYDTEDLMSVSSCSVEVGGAGSVTVWAKETLDVVAGGPVAVRYYGDPVVTEEITFPATLLNLGDK